MTKEELYNFAVSEIGGKDVVISFNKPNLKWLLGNYRIEGVSG
ncbi:hypothetical protein [Clostridium thailandense]|nr:hypothetical protein [Clostridium thailandense]